MNMENKVIRIKDLRAKRYNERVKNRLCVWCGTPLTEAQKGRLCKECAEKNRERSSQNRQWFLEHNICPICKKAEIVPPERSCLNCREKANNSMDEEKRAKRREISKKRMQSRKAAGLCPSCGKRKPEEGFITCDECRKRQRSRRKKSTEWSVKESWAWYGICMQCGSDDMMEGTKLCKKCYERCCSQLEKGRNVLKSMRDAKREEEYEKGLRKGKILTDPPITYKKRKLIKPDMKYAKNK
jgi:hypothetical protein